MSNINGLRIAICQMKSVPLNPIANATYMVGEIRAAAERGEHVIVFPEVCIHDYLNGDAIESVDLLRDIEIANRMVDEATHGIVAIYGSVTVIWKEKGEDGRVRKYNTGIVAQKGKRVHEAVKTLQPKYRMFFDSRHFFSLRQYAEEVSLGSGVSLESILKRNIRPVELETPIGNISMGVILCEDMWKDDYKINPAAILVENGADIIFNLSASPWTWRKNEKRHRVVKSLFPKKRVPFVYVNKTGFNHQGKSGYPFDGASTIYNQEGEVVAEVLQYWDGVESFVYQDNLPVIDTASPDDDEQLYSAMRCSVEGILKTISPKAKIMIGLSGGVDSSVVAAMFVDVAGSDRVVGVNMPYGSLNSDVTKNDARALAENLRIEYLIRPIDGIVGEMALASGVDPSDQVQFGNLLALARMNVLNGLSKNPQYKGVFTCNSNKTEMAFNYGTLYADIAGFWGILMDLTKYEVYQLGDYFNRKVYRFDVIPKSVFTRPPSAELEVGQRDPFDYGGITEHGFDPTERGYHDEMVRALTEFRWDWSDFLDKYHKRTLEQEMRLKPGRLARLFPTPEAFVADLEMRRSQFYYFKRLQAPPNIVFTKRGFGDDLRESVHMAALSQRYYELRAEVLAMSKSAGDTVTYHD